ncbi:hypothetical protein XENORESO_005191, partial [Xenotaenia resolanae]
LSGGLLGSSSEPILVHLALLGDGAVYPWVQSIRTALPITVRQLLCVVMKFQSTSLLRCCHLDGIYLSKSSRSRERSRNLSM